MTEKHFRFPRLSLGVTETRCTFIPWHARVDDRASPEPRHKRLSDNCSFACCGLSTGAATNAHAAEKATRHMGCFNGTLSITRSPKAKSVGARSFFTSRFAGDEAGRGGGVEGYRLNSPPHAQTESATNVTHTGGAPRSRNV